jgi:periplasmic protein TonB
MAPSEDRFVRIFDGRPRTTPRRLPDALTLSIAAHVCCALIVGVFVGRHGNRTEIASPRFEPDQLVWLSQPGLTGGGGGRESTPARRARLPGSISVTVPAQVAPSIESRATPAEPPEQPPIAIPALPAASGVEVVPGALQALADSDAGSQASGAGRNRGVGNGNDPGMGNGPRGFGDGPGGLGSGVTGPLLVTQIRPNYTDEAMRAQIQGIVALEAVVMPDGSVGDVKIVRSLDPRFGLDQEAIRTVKQWRFVPGTRRGQPVAVAVSVELTFTLR